MNFRFLSLFLYSEIRLQAKAHFRNQRASKVESYNSTFVLETQGGSVWITFMAPGVHEPLSLQLLWYLVIHTTLNAAAPLPLLLWVLPCSEGRIWWHLLLAVMITFGSLGHGGAGEKDYQGGRPIVSQPLSRREGRMPGCHCVSDSCQRCPGAAEGKRHLWGEGRAGDEVSAQRHACRHNIYREHMHAETAGKSGLMNILIDCHGTHTHTPGRNQKLTIKACSPVCHNMA